MHNETVETTESGLPLEPNIGNDQQNSGADDNVPATTEAKAPEPSQTQEQKEAPKEMPDWFMKDKYKTIDDQAKAYSELSSKMGRFWGSPQDNYSLEGIAGIEQNDPIIAHMMPALKEMGISQDGFKNLIDEYMKANESMAKSVAENLKKVMTTTDVHTFNEIDKWMTASLTKEEQDYVKQNWLMTPEDFKMFNSMRLMAAPNSSVPNGTSNSSNFESSSQVENDKIKYRKELKSGARVQDKNYENQLAARYRDAVAREIRSRK